MNDEVAGVRRYFTGSGLAPVLIRSFAGTGAVRIVAMIASFAVGVQLARGLGVEGYGYYGLALSVITTAGLPAEMGLATLITREVAAGAARDDNGYALGVLRWGQRFAVRTSLAICVAIVLFGAALHWFRPSPLPFVLTLGALAVPFRALARVDGAALQGLHHVVKGQVPINLLAPLAMSFLLVVSCLAKQQLDPAFAMGIYSLTAAAAWWVAASWLKPRLPRAEAYQPVHGRSGWISSLIPLAVNDGLFALQIQISILLLGALAAAGDVGLFRIAAAVATILALPQTIVLAVTMPTISRLYEQGDHKRLQVLLTHCARGQFVGTALLAAPLLIRPEPILALVFGGDYVAASGVLRIMLVAQLVNAAFGLNAQVLNMTRRERRVTRAMIVGVVVNGAAAAAFVPYSPLIGTASAYFLSMLAWNIFTWRDARNLVGVNTWILARASTGRA